MLHHGNGPFRSWGHYPRVRRQHVVPVRWRDDVPDLAAIEGTLLPRGCGRSYGDVCLNDDGVLLHTAPLNRFIAFDEAQGLLGCEAGVTLADILRLAVPRGWFLPTTPGTKYVTVGGAIANDVHGKNHHGAGTFGCHVTRFELLRSDGERLICSPDQNADLFRATIGGLGLTGLILWAEIQLRRVEGPYIAQERIQFRCLDEFFDLAAESDERFEYTMSWVDCLARGRHMGRGLFMRGNHSPAQPPPGQTPQPRALFTMPFEIPAFVLNLLTIKAFNAAYYRSQLSRVVRKDVFYDPFFYPLDAILDWNRLYGAPGFLQYQFVVPFAGDRRAVNEIFRQISSSGVVSFLAVLKVFGDVQSPGMLSFPRPGVTLALDFPYRGRRTLALLDRLDRIVCESGGAINPSKDARMSPESFQTFYPRWREFSEYIDPRFSSSFWRRVTRPLK